MATDHTYVEVFADEVPDNLRWDIPPRHQGQAVEVAYADAAHGAEPASAGDYWKRVTDHSVGDVTYWRRAR